MANATTSLVHANFGAARQAEMVAVAEVVAVVTIADVNPINQQASRSRANLLMVKVKATIIVEYAKHGVPILRNAATIIPRTKLALNLQAGAEVETAIGVAEMAVADQRVAEAVALRPEPLVRHTME